MRLTLADVLTLAGDSDELLDAIAEVMAPRPTTAADVIEFLNVPTGSVFSLPPEQALAYFKAKGLRPTFSYADMLDEAHDAAFTVAKMMDVDMLAHVRASLDDALANGIPFRQWADEIIPTLQSAGWWGKKMVVDPVTGQSVVAQLGSAGRLKTIFRTNMQAAYAAGAWQEIEAAKDSAPWLMYDAVDDHRTREEHASWDRTVLKVGDPWWNDHFPPNGYNCRCHTIQLSDDEVKALGLEPDPPGGPNYGFKDWKNPRTGMIEAIPWGLDPGFAHNPGKSHLKALKKALKEKVDVLPASMQASASDGIAATAAAAEDAKEAAKAALMAEVAKAQKELAKVAGAAHLKAAVEKAHAQAAAVAKAAEDAKKAIAAAKVAEAETLAKGKLDAIVKAGGANTYEKAALKKLLSDNAWSALPATQRLEQFEALAANLKAKQLTDTKLAKYKAAVLAGKTPPPNVAKVLDEITPEQKAAFLAKLDAEVGAKQAAEEAAQKAALEKEFDDAVEAAKNDPDLALTPGEVPIFDQVVKTILAAPPDVRLPAFKQYVDGLKASKAKVANDAADALQKEIDTFPVASGPNDPGLPGGWGHPLAQELLTLSKSIETQILDVFPKLSTTDKLFHVGKWKKQWADLKTEIVAAKAEVTLKADTTNELETIAKALHAVPLQEAKDLSNAIFSDMLAGKLDNFTLEALQAYKLGAMNKLDELAAKAASQPAPPPAPTSASKQWLNVEASAHNLFVDVLDAGDNGLADTITHYMGLPNWKSGKWTLKQKKAFIETWKAEHATWKASKASPPAAAPPPPAASATPQAGVDTLLATKAPDPARLTQIGPQKGSNPGGLFQDTTTGEKFYVKWFDSDERARNELLAGKLYELVGAETPELAVFKWPDGRTALSSRWVDGLKGKQPPGVIAAADGAYDYFAADAWLANWDVVGQEFDNLVLKGTKAFRVDVGGALRFRAQGTAKGADFGDDVVEIDSLRKPGRNSQAVAVFKDISDDQILAGVRRVLKPSDDQIRQLVEKFGPTNKVERDKLLKTLLARREYLRKRFPNAVSQPTRTTVTAAPGARTGKVIVEPDDHKAIVNSRGNGYTVRTDGPDIEDHQVLVSQMVDKRGQTFTRTTLKLTPSARERVFRMLKPNVQGVAATVDDTVEQLGLSEAKSSVLQWVKGVNLRKSKGEILEPKDIERAHNAIAKLDEAIAALEKMSGRLDAAGETFRNAHWLELRSIRAQVKDFLDRGNTAGKVADALIPKIDLDVLPDVGSYQKLVLAKPKPTATVVTWKARATMPNEPTKLDRGRYYIQDAKGAGQDFGAPIFEGTGPNGERILAALDPNTARAPYGTVIIDTPGADALAAQRAFDLLDETLKVRSTHTTPLERDEQYLNAFARMRLFTNKSKTTWDEYRILDAQFPDPAARVQAKLAFLNKKLGLDIEKSSGWAQRDGVEQAFGHGRISQYRPDTDSQEWRDFEADTLVYHNPGGLGHDSGDDAGDKLMRLVDSGGNILAQMERIRRGIYGSGASPTADRRSGGAAYVFTRLFKRGANDGTGYYWKGSVTRRLDAISYSGDNYGATDDGHLLSNRRTTVKELESARSQYGNETIFKHGLSIFDDLEAIVVKDNQVASLISQLQAHGYQTWPDGRRLDQVIIGKSKWRQMQKRSP